MKDLFIMILAPYSSADFYKYAVWFSCGINNIANMISSSHAQSGLFRTAIFTNRYDLEQNINLYFKLMQITVAAR
jgi:hypothetical protein